MTELPSPPWFADGGVSDPERRMADLEHYAHEFFRLCNPRLMQRLPPEDQRDLQRDIILHFIADNFRVLRQFRQTGANFDAWFCTVCLNQMKDFLKKRNRYRQVVFDDPDGAAQLAAHDRTQQNPEEATHRRRLVAEVSRGIGLLDRYCRLLIRLGGEEFKPREIVRVLRWPQEKAKKVSDDLAYCKEKLRKLLAERGITDI